MQIYQLSVWWLLITVVQLRCSFSTGALVVEIITTADSSHLSPSWLHFAGICPINIMAEFTDQEIANLAKAFKDLGVKPKTDSPEDLREWMEQYVKQDPKAKVPSVAVLPQLPRIVLFSGEPKGDHASFDLWKYEVKSLLKEQMYPTEAIYQAARKSLRGEASRVAMRLGPSGNISSLLEKLENIFGTVELTENLLAQFYSAAQGDDEDVASWGCRLEDILTKAIDQGYADHGSYNEMIYTKFWTGLRKELKDATRHNFETIKDFEKLRVQVRRVEHEQKLGNKSEDKIKKTAHVKMAAQKKCEAVEGMEELRGMIHSLTTKMDTLQKEVEGSKKLALGSSPSGYVPRGNTTVTGPASTSTVQANSREPVCWRCKRPGHIEKGCRAYVPEASNTRQTYNPDGLNSRQSMGRGRPWAAGTNAPQDWNWYNRN